MASRGQYRVLKSAKNVSLGIDEHLILLGAPLKARKIRKKSTSKPGLFTRAVWKTLTKRERELNSGRGVEVASTAELRSAVSHSRSKSAA